ncbi:MAG: hypothetical protein AAGF24_06500 [Cyanobacteria bacterium P01_H01_bin.121]
MNEVTEVTSESSQIIEETAGSSKVELSIMLDRELVEQVSHLTNDPSRVIEAAVRRWLRGEAYREDDLARILPRNTPLPPRGEWND